MLKKDCFFLGIIIKKYSFKGEMIIKFEGDYSKMYSDLKSIYIELSGSLVCFKINKLQKHKSFFLRILILMYLILYLKILKIHKQKVKLS